MTLKLTPEELCQMRADLSLPKGYPVDDRATIGQLLDALEAAYAENEQLNLRLQRNEELLKKAEELAASTKHYWDMTPHPNVPAYECELLAASFLSDLKKHREGSDEHREGEG